ncbi:MAG: DUF47 family protein, partial [Xanthomonadales bacterium]|nr:DUF47 family protein [Xanthomonadales bacterium]NIX13353.1 DUF47 family protein [Xanthomonadales bacterium]
MSRKSTLTRLFRNSPFKALQQHMRVVLDCARHVGPLIEALAADDEAAVHEARDRIYELEAKADRIKNKLRLHMPKSLFMPVDRRDLLEILHLQETIANTAQDIAGLMIQRKMTIPGFMREPLIALTRRCIDTCEHSAKAIEELDELL